jgi:hypothetical protein
LFFDLVFVLALTKNLARADLPSHVERCLPDGCSTLAPATGEWLTERAVGGSAVSLLDSVLSSAALRLLATVRSRPI